MLCYLCLYRSGFKLFAYNLQIHIIIPQHIYDFIVVYILSLWELFISVCYCCLLFNKSFTLHLIVYVSSLIWDIFIWKGERKQTLLAHQLVWTVNRHVHHTHTHKYKYFYKCKNTQTKTCICMNILPNIKTHNQLLHTNTCTQTHTYHISK